MIRCSVPIVVVGMLAAAGHADAQLLILEDAINPSWSPAGDELVCARPAAADGAEIWRVSDDGGQAEIILTDADGGWHPMWMPDGDHIVYPRVREQAEYVIFPLAGGDPVVWEAPAFWDDPGFRLTPDGTEVLYTSPGMDEIWAFDLTDGSARFLREGYGASISPDGQWLAFTTVDHILAVEPVGGGPLVLLEPGGFPSWTADSEFIVFTGAEDGEPYDLIAVKRDGSCRQQLTDDPDWEWINSVSPEGSRVAYGKGPGEFGPFDLWILELDLPPTPVREMTWGTLKSLYR